MKQNYLKPVFIVMLLLGAFVAQAQYNLSGKVVDAKDEALAGATVVLMSADSLMGGTITNAKGAFELKGLPGMDYVCVISMMGYKNHEQNFSLNKNTKIGTIVLQEDAQQLETLTVDADRRDRITVGAGMSTFLLSEKALEADNVYEAFREIPKLLVNETERTIKLNTGGTPIILVNGVNRPGYVNSLDPSLIESVEVIENPSARYRGEQKVHAIVNIKTKRSEKSYLNGTLFSKHHVEGVFGVSGGSFEVGNSKSSLYLNAQHFYFHNDDGEQSSYSNTGNLIRDWEGNSRYKSQSVSINVGGDLVASDNDYLAFAISYINNPQKYGSKGTGSIFETAYPDKFPMRIDQYTRNTYFDNSYNFYYKHTFAEDNYLEATGAFGLYGSGAKGSGSEQSDIYAYNSLIDLDNKKKSLKLELNYDFAPSDKVALSFGANTYLQHTTIDDRASGAPRFHDKEATEYLYAAIRNKQQAKFSYMFSLGLDLVFADIAGYGNNYVNFVPAASLGYTLNEKSSFQLSYSRNRISPDAAYLNPYNTSTDSLRQSVGNPYLKPYIDNIVQFSYTWNHKGIYLSPFIAYDYSSDQISTIGYMEGNIYKQTYGNLDKLQQLQVGASVRFNLSHFGNLNLTAYYQRDYIDDMPFSGKSLQGNASLNLWYKKVSLYAYVWLVGNTYTRTTKSYGTPESEMTLTWKLPKGWALNAGLRYFAVGDNHYEGWTDSEGYTTHVKQKMTDRYLMPMIGISYNFNNKVNKKWRQQQRLQNTDKGLGNIKAE